MERVVTVEFGPSRSKRFGKAVAEARSGAGECSELAPNRYRARFVLGRDFGAYIGLARLLERVRYWRATEVYEDDELLSGDHAREMAWCASAQLKTFGDCRFRFDLGVLPRCSLCPLFDAERVIRDLLGEIGPPGMVFEIRFGPRAQALLRGSHHRGMRKDSIEIGRSPTLRRKSGETRPARKEQAEGITRHLSRSFTRNDGNSIMSRAVLATR